MNSDPAGQVSVPFNRRLRAPHQAQLEVLDRMIRDAGEVYGSDDQRTGALTSARAALYATGMLHWLIGQLDQADAIPPMFEDMVRAHQRQLDGILDGTPVHVVQETLG